MKIGFMLALLHAIFTTDIYSWKRRFKLIITFLLSSHREALFWFLIKIRNIIDPDCDINHHLFHIQQHSIFRQIVTDDWDWLIHAIHKKNFLPKRSVAFYALILLWNQRGISDRELSVLKKKTKIIQI